MTPKVARAACIPEAGSRSLSRFSTAPAKLRIFLLDLLDEQAAIKKGSRPRPWLGGWAQQGYLRFAFRSIHLFSFRSYGYEALSLFFSPCSRLLLRLLPCGLLISQTPTFGLS